MGRRRKKFPKKRKKIENYASITFRISLKELKTSIITAANQSKLEATHDQREARGKVVQAVYEWYGLCA